MHFTLDFNIILSVGPPPPPPTPAYPCQAPPQGLARQGVHQGPRSCWKGQTRMRDTGLGEAGSRQGRRWGGTRGRAIVQGVCCCHRLRVGRAVAAARCGPAALVGPALPGAGAEQAQAPAAWPCGLAGLGSSRRRALGAKSRVRAAHSVRSGWCLRVDSLFVGGCSCSGLHTIPTHACLLYWLQTLSSDKAPLRAGTLRGG